MYEAKEIKSNNKINSDNKRERLDYKKKMMSLL